MALPELLADDPVPGTNTPNATLAAAVLTAPAAGTQEAWTFVAAPQPTALQAPGQYHFVIDNEECLDVTGAGGTARTIVRGVNGVIAPHAAGAQVKNDLTAASLTAALAAASARGAVVDTPELHGAKRDGRLVLGTFTTGTKVFTATTGTFTAADVGKVFVLRNPASPYHTFVTTVASYTDAAHVVLTADAGANYASTFACLGTDDTAAVAAAVQGAVTTAQGLGLNAAKVALSEGIYILNGATTKNATYYGNAQIPLPVISPVTASKFALVIEGPIPADAQQHWDQTMPNLTGSVLFSTLQGLSIDGTWGPPSIIGGPTKTAQVSQGVTGFGGANNEWMNMHAIFRNFMIAVPFNPTQGAIDVREVANASVDGVGIFPFSTQLDLFSTGSSNFNAGGVGVYMPTLGNNALGEIGSLTVRGYNYGVGLADHANAKRLGLIYCNSAIVIGENGTGTPQEGIHIDYADVEGCTIGVDASIFNAAGGLSIFPLTIDHYDCEVTGTYDIDDPNNYLAGRITIANINQGTTGPKVNGAANMEIINVFQPRGHQAPPAVPASGTASVPVWRHAAVTVTGGTVTAIAVDGTATGLTSGTVIVPSGKTITLTYTVAPSWNWVLL